jgi:hypothetical protein
MQYYAQKAFPKTHEWSISSHHDCRQIRVLDCVITGIDGVLANPVDDCET